MDAFTVTITSKNQITLPARLVRELKLTKNRRLDLLRVGNTVTLRPKLSFEEKMKPIWAEIAKQRAGKPAPTNEELSRAAREIWASGEVEFR